ncbi:MAG: hypothetical protein ACREX8_03655 [Gammaproteobacteria bacterium]
MDVRGVYFEPSAVAAVGCALRVTGEGSLTVHRDPGCTPDNVTELCAALISGELTIVDLTEPGQ